jgi:hypothetical protein
MMRVIAPGVVVASAVCFAADAHAVDPFEIQVYDGTADAPGEAGLELHLNDWATGHRDAVAPELPLHGQSHATLEPSFGVTAFWELGAYLQTALRDDGIFEYAGAKLRSKFVTPPHWDRHWRLGLNLEVALLPQNYDRNRWGAEVRPIVGWASDDWLFVVNPIFDQPLAGSDASAGPSFEPAAKASRRWGPIALGLEYYASFGPLSAPLAWRSQEQYVYETVDVLSIADFELNVGVGEGLTPASAGVVAKVIVGYSIETRSECAASELAKGMP